MIKFQAVRKHNGKPVATGTVGKKKLATFTCTANQLKQVAGTLEPVGEIIECGIVGHPLTILTCSNKTIIRPRQLFTRFFDFYRVRG